MDTKNNILMASPVVPSAKDQAVRNVESFNDGSSITYEDLKSSESKRFGLIYGRMASVWDQLNLFSETGDVKHILAAEADSNQMVDDGLLIWDDEYTFAEGLPGILLPVLRILKHRRSDKLSEVAAAIVMRTISVFEVSGNEIYMGSSRFGGMGRSNILYGEEGVAHVFQLLASVFKNPLFLDVSTGLLSFEKPQLDNVTRESIATDKELANYYMSAVSNGGDIKINNFSLAERFGACKFTRETLNEMLLRKHFPVTLQSLRQLAHEQLQQTLIGPISEINSRFVMLAEEVLASRNSRETGDAQLQYAGEKSRYKGICQHVLADREDREDRIVANIERYFVTEQCESQIPLVLSQTALVSDEPFVDIINIPVSEADLIVKVLLGYGRDSKLVIPHASGAVFQADLRFFRILADQFQTPCTMSEAVSRIMEYFKSMQPKCVRALRMILQNKHSETFWDFLQNALESEGSVYIYEGALLPIFKDDSSPDI